MKKKFSSFSIFNAYLLRVSCVSVFFLAILFVKSLPAQVPGCVTPDVIPPVITPLSGNITIVLGPAGTRTITLADIATISDNCNPNPPYTLSAANFNCSHRGQQTITVNATDGAFGTPPTPSAVSFSQVYGVAVDAAGNIYLADLPNQCIRKISTTGLVTTLAGSGSSGFADGVGTSARFHNPVDLAVDASGNVYVADQVNNRIRKITPAGVVTTLAGSGTAGSADGTGIAASFSEPYGIAIDAAGNLYIADSDNNRIRKISQAGVVTTIAGSNSGYIDGPGPAAKFFFPTDLTVDAAGNIYVADNGNRLIRKIDPSGMVSTFAGNGVSGFVDGINTAASFSNPFHITIDPSGNLFVTDANNHAIRKINTVGDVSTIAGNGTNGSADGPGATAQFFYPYGIASDGAGNLIIGDALNYKIRKINTANIVSTLAGSGVSGNQNGSIGGVPASGNQSSLQITVIVVQSPPVITSPPNPEITINVGANCTAPIPDFRINATATSGCGAVTLTQSPTQGVPAPLGRRPVTIIATDIYGMESYQTTYIDIVDGSVPIITPVSNNIVIPLNANGTRTITLADVATIADNCNSNPPYTISPVTFNCNTTGAQTVTVTTTDGSFGGPLTPGAASFSNPFGLDFDAAGNMYIADQSNNKIRKLSAGGTVSTVAGSGAAGFSNGTGAAAMFDDPRGIAIDGSGNVYTSDIDNHKIRKITPAGVVSTFAGSTQGYADGNSTIAQFSSPRGLAFDAQGNLYVADAFNARIRKITPAGVVTTVAGNGNFSSVDGPAATASFYEPVDLALDASGNIYVIEASGNKIRKISTTGIVSTIAGDGTYGYNDGPGNTAKFAGPQALTVDNAGNLYVADLGNNRIRKITAANVVSTIAVSGYPSGITMGSNGNLYMTDFGNYIKMVTPSGVVTTLAGTNAAGAQDGVVGVPASGNQSTLQIPITITGQSTPVFSTTQTNVSVVANANCSATLANYASAAAATSSCGGAVTISQSPVAGTVLPIGATTVTLTATDASNNTATQTFVVTVTDNAAPVITPLSTNTIINLDANGTKTITVSDIATITDCNTSPSVRINPSAFNCASIGNQTITVEATDGIFGPPTPAAVSFSNPIAIAADNAGNFYVADRGTHTIRKINLEGQVTLFAGSVAGYADGNGTAARFNVIFDIATDAAGNVYVVDAGNRRIRKITPAGVVTTIAGNGSAVAADGTGTSASFENPIAITVDNQGIIYVGDFSRIRKITPGAVVTTVAGTTAGFADGTGASAKFWSISGLTTDASGNLYIADGANYRVRKMTPSAVVTTIAGGSGQFGFLQAVVIDASGSLYVCDNDNNVIKKVSASGVVSNVAGSGSPGATDGAGAAASFNGPFGMTISNDELYVADYNNNKVRKVTISGVSTTFAGSGVYGSQNGNISGITGNYSSLQIPVIIRDATAPVITPVSNNITIPLNANGTRTITLADVATVTDNCNNSPAVRISPSTFDCSSVGTQTVTVEATDGIFGTPTPGAVSFSSPVAIANDNTGIFYVADRGTELIRKISAAGEVTLFAGGSGSGYIDGQGASAKFNTVSDIVVDGAGNIYVADAGNRRIRKITPGGLVSTLAGNGIANSIDGIGTSASFESPNAITADVFGNIYVADASKIRKINTSGTVITVAGSTAGFADGNGLNTKFWGPSGLTTDAAGNLYIADGANYRVRKMTPAADVTTIAGGTGQFGFLQAIVRNAAGDIYLCDGDNYMIKKVSANGIVSTIAGSGSPGMIDGTGAAAGFNGIYGLAMSGGNLYVSEFDNHKIRKVTTAGVVTTFAGSGSQGIANGNISGITGNYSSLQIPVTITGQSVPVFTSTQSNISLFANNTCNAALSNYATQATATALCGGTITITQSPEAGTIIPAGTTTVTLSAANTAGTSTQSFIVTVTDNTAPLITCPANITTATTATDPNQTGWATATDNCTAASSIVITYTDNTQGCNINRTWKATDAAGNFSTCLQTIAIPQMSVTLGPDMYILYGALGYVGCKTITPVITGGVAPYTYIWTSTQPSVNNVTTPSVFVCNTTEITHTYTVTVTGATGCVATATIVLHFIDISCSNNGNNIKVSVCLRPQGNANNCHNVCVSQNAAPGLVSNGSYYGQCLPGCEVPIQGRGAITESTLIIGGNETPKQTESKRNMLKVIKHKTEISDKQSVFNVRVLNNPTETSFRLIVNSPSVEKIIIRLFDATGRVIGNNQTVAPGEIIELGRWCVSGMYFAEITQGENFKVVKLIKQ